MAGVSGGAWFTSEFTNNPDRLDDPDDPDGPVSIDFKAFSERIRKSFTNLSLPVGHSPYTYQRLHEVLETTRAFRPNNNCSFVDMFGLLLNESWRKDFDPAYRVNARLSEQQGLIAGGLKPLPIYSLVRPLPMASRSGPRDECYESWELSPFELACVEAETAVPTWAFGRQFHRGRSVLMAPEAPAACLLGIVGSAFCGSVEEIERIVTPKLGPLTGEMLKVTKVARKLN